MDLIFDRVPQDTTIAHEIKARYKRNGWGDLADSEKAQLERGCYTFNSLNRVEQTQRQLADLLNKNGYQVNITTKTWDETNYFNISELQRLLNNLTILRNTGLIYATTPNVPNDYKPYINANNIEKILFDIEDILKKVVSAFRYSNTFYSNMEGLR